MLQAAHRAFVQGVATHFLSRKTRKTRKTQHTILPMSLSNLKPFLTSREVAGLLLVSADTIRLWTNKGVLKSVTTLGGHRRFRRSDIEPLAAAYHKPESNSEPQEKSLTVLIIEDEVDLAQTMADGLVSAVPGMTIHISTDGFSGGLKASLHNPDFVLLDLMMPGMNGVEVCRMLKAEAATQHIRVIAYTGHANADQVEAVLAQGAEACLDKPIRIPKLLIALGLSRQPKAAVTN